MAVESASLQRDEPAAPALGAAHRTDNDLRILCAMLDTESRRWKAEVTK